MDGSTKIRRSATCEIRDALAKTTAVAMPMKPKNGAESGQASNIMFIMARKGWFLDQKKCEHGRRGVAMQRNDERTMSYAAKDNKMMKHKQQNNLENTGAGREDSERDSREGAW